MGRHCPAAFEESSIDQQGIVSRMTGNQDESNILVDPSGEFFSRIAYFGWLIDASVIAPASSARLQARTIKGGNGVGLRSCWELHPEQRRPGRAAGDSMARTRNSAHPVPRRFFSRKGQGQVRGRCSERSTQSLSHKGPSVRLPPASGNGTRRPYPRAQGGGASTGSSPV